MQKPSGNTVQHFSCDKLQIYIISGLYCSYTLHRQCPSLVERAGDDQDEDGDEHHQQPDRQSPQVNHGFACGEAQFLINSYYNHRSIVRVSHLLQLSPGRAWGDEKSGEVAPAFLLSSMLWK